MKNISFKSKMEPFIPIYLFIKDLKIEIQKKFYSFSRKVKISSFYIYYKLFPIVEKKTKNFNRIQHYIYTCINTIFNTPSPILFSKI